MYIPNYVIGIAGQIDIDHNFWVKALTMIFLPKPAVFWTKNPTILLTFHSWP